ncbi:hypothetical protein BVC71_04615 [Marivivens niveibacter]|uniref:DUF1499 domain-containing protein n=1 Tax=Marivivens niveibacter TaxID=1930667 RepID=A0A251X227_9RHOB|nr:DUF1499 domain-containing protein [Marivivens niveibacter]OUD10770.1 hypothetical protein BVC71_04615 [Marivivens niveibacter]
MKIVALIVALFLGFAAYVRLAPLDAQRFFKRNDAADTGGIGEYPLDGGYAIVRENTTDALERIKAAALATDRTGLFAGSVQDGHMLFVTRSALWGFPDYTNVYINDEGLLVVSGHLRFGRSDLGVNQRRVTEWLTVAGLS